MRVLPWEGINPGLPQWVLEMAGCLYKTKPRPIIPVTRSLAQAWCHVTIIPATGKDGAGRSGVSEKPGQLSKAHSQSKAKGEGYSPVVESSSNIENRDLIFRWRPMDRVWPVNRSDSVSHHEISPTEGSHHLPRGPHRRPQNCSVPILGFQSQNCELSK